MIEHKEKEKIGKLWKIIKIENILEGEDVESGKINPQVVRVSIMAWT